MITKINCKMQFYRVNNATEKHYDHQYKDGVNKLTGKFNSDPMDKCGPGGFYFTDRTNLIRYLKDGAYIYEITIPTHANVVDLNGKYRTDCMILGKRYDLTDRSTWDMFDFPANYYFMHVSQYCHLTIEFIRQHATELDWHLMSYHQPVLKSKDAITEFSGYIHWNELSKRTDLDYDTIAYFSDQLIWDTLSRFRMFTLEGVRRFQDKIVWDVCMYDSDEYQQIADEFPDKVNRQIISDYESYKQMCVA